MKQIQVLDCTLRDGGYVNNWEFGEDTILAVRHALAKAGVEIAELGFFRDEPYSADRAVFNATEQAAKIIGQQEPGMIYAGLIEMANYYPPELLPVYNGSGPEAIRYSFWMRLMDDAYDYCSKIAAKGYKLCCQPTRVEQYSDEQFAAMCRRFSELNPYALYIVDTFGLLQKDDLLRYARIGHENLAPGIILGYHAHDNMGQAFGNACAFLEQNYDDRVIQVDASIGGMGRGAGNLRLEAILHYLNTRHGAAYDLAPIYDVWDKHLADVKKNHPWGQELPYFITAANACNPNYASDFMAMGMSVSEVYAAIQRIEGPDKYLYSREKALHYSGKGATQDEEA